MRLDRREHDAEVWFGLGRVAWRGEGRLREHGDDPEKQHTRHRPSWREGRATPDDGTTPGA